MADYAKLKNADLENKLKERGLPHTGKKAEMVARLQEDDKNKASGAAPAAAAPEEEDKIDWDDEATEVAPAASSAPGAAALAAGGQGQVDNPQSVPNQVVDTDPAKTDDLAVKAPADDATATEVPVEAEKKPETDFTSGIAATNIEEEIEKRRKRAEKFGLKIEDDKDAQEAMQKLERLKKFGTTTTPKGLDEALPERTMKRGRDAGDEGRRGGFKRRGGGPPGRRGNPRRGGGRREDRPREANGSWMTDKDREAAAKRKDRFA